MESVLKNTKKASPEVEWEEVQAVAVWQEKCVLDDKEPATGKIPASPPPTKLKSSSSSESSDSGEDK